MNNTGFADSDEYGAALKERPAVSRRGLALLGVLLAIAVGLALFDAVVVPGNWREWLPVPRLAVVPEPDRARVAGTPETPGAGTAGIGRGLFGTFGAPRPHISGFAADMSGLVLLLSAGVLTLFIMPRRIARLASSIGSGPGSVARLALAGFAGFLLLGVAGILSAATLLGGLALLFMTLASFLILLIGLVAASLPLGRFAARRVGAFYEHPVVFLLAGLMMLYILYLLPFVGIVALVLVALIGFGALLETRFGSERNWDLELESLRY